MPDPLAQAFHLLLGEAPAERRDQALRVAIKVLVDSPRQRLGNRSPNITGAELSVVDWVKRDYRITLLIVTEFSYGCRALAGTLP